MNVAATVQVVPQKGGLVMIMTTQYGTAATVMLIKMNSATSTMTSVASVMILKTVSSVEEPYAAAIKLWVFPTNPKKSGGLNTSV